MKTKTVSYTETPFGMNYQIFYPEDEKTEGLPLLVYLHGAGERGVNLPHIFRHGVPKLIKEGRELPAIVLCPQCPAEYVWDNVVERVKGIIDAVAAEFAVQKDRICLTGSSMGGFGSFMLAKTYGGFFSAVAPISGGGMSWRACNLVNTPLWAIHGALDTLVPPILSELMVNATVAAGGSARLTLLENKGHNDGIDEAYRNTEVLSWLLAQRRTDFTPPHEFCSELF